MKRSFVLAIFFVPLFLMGQSSLELNWTKNKFREIGETKWTRISLNKTSTFSGLMERYQDSSLEWKRSRDWGKASLIAYAVGLTTVVIIWNERDKIESSTFFVSLDTFAYWLSSLTLISVAVMPGIVISKIHLSKAVKSYNKSLSERTGFQKDHELKFAFTQNGLGLTFSF
ncbi:MAG: hypothetical protein HKN39_01415 [Flavobacteriales bacterium]|nr:hypothetical protein [Flavobacteriales bacterium]